MTKANRYPTREPVKENQVYRLLRDKVVDGHWLRGDRIAARRDLEEQLGVSRVTLQRVLHRLIKEGFVEARGPLGTFVATNPPHLARYAVVMPHRPTQARPWAGFLKALANEAARDRDDQLQIPLFHDDEGHTDSEDHQELLRSVLGRRFAGILFATSPFHLQGNPILEEPGIPRVSLMGSSSTFGIDTLRLDGDALVERAMDRFVELGHRKVAVVSTTEWFSAMGPRLESAMKSRGLSVPEYWMQGVDRRSPAWAGRVVRLLLSARPSERPSALFLADDNIVAEATQGIVASRISPSKLNVISHCNFPWPPPSEFPTTWIGFDVGKILNRGIELLDAQRAGRTSPMATTIQPQFEDELEERTTPSLTNTEAAVEAAHVRSQP